MSSKSNVENLSPQVIRQVSKQISELVQNPPEGVKIHVNEDDICDIKATIEGPAGTPYFNGSFKVRIILGKNFPQSSPSAFFGTKIFHPNVNSRTGEICVNTLKKDWKPDLGIKHILLTIKCLLIVPNPESALNEEAGKLLLEQYEDYCRRAKMMTEIHAQSNSNQSTKSIQKEDGQQVGQKKVGATGSAHSTTTVISTTSILESTFLNIGEPCSSSSSSSTTTSTTKCSSSTSSNLASTENLEPLTKKHAGDKSCGSSGSMAASKSSSSASESRSKSKQLSKNKRTLKRL